MATITKDVVLKALEPVQDPDLGRSLLSLGMIQDLQISAQGDVSLKVMLTTPACPLKKKIEDDVRNALTQVNGIGRIEIKMDAQVRGGSRSQNPAQKVLGNVQNLIAVSSGKGGVGKSTVSTNLAVSLALEGARVGLMDADIYGPNLPTMMGVSDQPKIENHPELGEVFLPPTIHGVKVMSMGFLIEADQPVVWRGPMLHNVLTQFCQKVQWGDLDYLVIDMPPGTGDVQLSLAQLVPITGAVMVTTPQEVAQQDVRKAISMWEKVRVPIVGIVENMSYFICPNCTEKHRLLGEGGGAALAKKYGTELLAQVPMMSVVREGGDEGKPVVVKDPNAPSAQVLRDLARKVAQKISIQTAARGQGPEFVQIGRFN